VNSARARSGGALIFVDGQAGPITVGALRALGSGLPPAENYPTNQRITSRVLISTALATQLEQNPPVADPPRPRSSVPATTGTSSSGGGAISTDPAAPGVMLDEGANQSALADALPWVIGGTAALVLVGGFFVWRRKRVKPNRRRRVKKNVRKKPKTIAIVRQKGAVVYVRGRAFQYPSTEIARKAAAAIRRGGY